MSEMKTIKFPGDIEPREVVDAAARQRIAALENSSGGAVLYTEQTRTEEEKARARQNIGAAAVGDKQDCHADLFTITDDGVVSLKPAYRGACPANRSSYSYAISDNGLGVAGSKNTELPSRLVIPEVVNEIAVVSLAPAMFLQNKTVETIVIPDCATVIPERFCDMASNLKEISNTECIMEIGAAAFQATCLKRAKFPNLNNMGQYAFHYCCFLIYADIGNVTSIPLNAFGMCSMLSRIKGGAQVKTVGETAFWCNYRLNSVEFLPNLTTIGNSAFQKCRLDFDWSSLTGCSFGTTATALQLNPTDIWSACAVTARENAVPTLLSQADPRWKNKEIGTSNVKYGDGCVLFTVMHIYCALHNLTLSSVEEFEEIVNTINPNLLNNFTGEESYIGPFLEGLGLKVEHYDSFTQESLQAVYNGVAAGKYATARMAPRYNSTVSHVAMIYGVKDNKEFLIADSGSMAPATQMGGGGETIQYSMHHKNYCRADYDVFIVSLKEE